MARAGAQRLKTDWRKWRGGTCLGTDPSACLRGSRRTRTDLVSPPCRGHSARDGPKPVRGRGEKKTACDLQQHHLRDLETGESFSRTLLPTPPPDQLVLRSSLLN